MFAALTREIFLSCDLCDHLIILLKPEEAISIALDRHRGEGGAGGALAPPLFWLIKLLFQFFSLTQKSSSTSEETAFS